MRELLLDAADMRRTLGRMAHEILEANQGAENLVVVGILSGGWPLAKRLAFSMSQIEGIAVPLGKIDIRRFRDDRPQDQETPETSIPVEITGRTVILVDEVMFTGRTARAALDALFSLGRPSSVQLAVLVDRGHRELPLQPNYCGKHVGTGREDHVKVSYGESGSEDSVVLEVAASGAG
jgi:pyrimidine operon attenuation protein/uracil phosphoribosyltransferase